MSIYPGDDELEKAIALGDDLQAAILLRMRTFLRWSNEDVDGAIIDVQEAAKRYGAVGRKVDQFITLSSAIPPLVSCGRILEAEYFLSEAETLLDQIDPAAFPPTTEQTLILLNAQESPTTDKMKSTKSPGDFYRESLVFCRSIIKNGIKKP